MTADQLKALLNTPVALFVLMMLASAVSAWKQIADAQKNGSEVTWVSYLSHIPEGITVVLGNTLAFAVLILTDQLNFASALGIGYGINSVADLVRSGGRSLEVSGLTSVEGKK